MSLMDFKVLEKLGSGAYSSVYRVERLLDNEIYALKKVNLSGMTPKEQQNALNEVRILASIRHPGVIGYREAFLDENTKSLCIVMEFADNGDLHKKITEKMNTETSFKQTQIWSIFIQIARGLNSLHKKNILHRDLKSANVFLFENGKAKIGDLNVSKILEKGLCRTQTGTPYYASPEVWKDEMYGPKSDIWSLGCVLYEMVALKPPFQAEDMESLFKTVIKGEYPKIPDQYSSDLSDLLRYMLQVNPLKRPSSERLLNMAIVQKRAKNLIEQKYINPVFLQTIRVPTDIYYLSESLPKSNYYSPKKIQNARYSESKTPKTIHKNHSINRTREKNNSYAINHRTIINAARKEIQVENSLTIEPESMIKRRKIKQEGKTKQTNRKLLKKESKMERIQQIYKGVYKGH